MRTLWAAREVPRGVLKAMIHFLYPSPSLLAVSVSRLHPGRRRRATLGADALVLPVSRVTAADDPQVSRHSPGEADIMVVASGPWSMSRIVSKSRIGPWCFLPQPALARRRNGRKASRPVAMSSDAPAAGSGTGTPVARIIKLPSTTRTNVLVSNDTWLEMRVGS